jgi:hypothetical protein
MLYGPAVARRRMREIPTGEDWEAFAKFHWPIERVVAARYRRYAYPRDARHFRLGRRT